VSAAHELLAPSHSHADALRAVHGGLALRVVEPGVEECFLATGRDATSVAPREGALRVLHAGNHGWWKGSCDLLDAFEEIDREDATLVLAGTGIDASWTRRLARAARLARLEQHGAYEPDGLARLAAGCDVAVFPSRLAESFGLAAAECGAAGLELVVSDRGDLPERVGGDASLVVPAGDARALARMLERLADAKFSGRLRRGAQRRARDTDACVRELLA
jgi:glycosyltransferase involved in cell wall biosynthesis